MKSEYAPVPVEYDRATRILKQVMNTDERLFANLVKVASSYAQGKYGIDAVSKFYSQFVVPSEKFRNNTETSFMIFCVDQMLTGSKVDEEYKIGLRKLSEVFQKEDANTVAVNYVKRKLNQPLNLPDHKAIEMTVRK